MYNSYNWIEADSWYYGPEGEDAMVVYRPVCITSFMLDDNCHRGRASGVPFFVDEQIILTSASSKTAFSLASMLKQRGTTVIGLTSSRNEEFVKTLGLYSSVVTYDDVGAIDSSTKTIVIDMAGEFTVGLALDKHLGLQPQENHRSRINAGEVVCLRTS